MSVSACVLVIVGSSVLLKGVYDWTGRPGRVAAQPIQHDRVVVYVAATVVIIGAVLFAVAGTSTPALAMAATAVIPVLVVLPRSYTINVVLVPCLVTVMLAMVLAVRGVVAPQARVAPLAVAAFAVVLVAGTFMLVGLLDAVVLFDSTDVSEHRQTVGRRVAYLSGLVLLSAPLLLMLDGRRAAAAATVPFGLVALLSVRQLGLLAGLLYLLTGPTAVAATIQAMFTSRR